MGNEQTILQQAKAEAVEKDNGSRARDAIPLIWNTDEIPDNKLGWGRGGEEQTMILTLDHHATQTEHPSDSRTTI
jgi:CRISPR/Cas system CSM-associated protein Csm5 (group 7 of RAMP superfamily)